jgi:formate dehydrogenase major subunit
MSPELADELGIQHGSFVTVTTPRGIIEARAMVTQRMTPIQMGEKIVHQVGLPYHWGYKGLVKGDAVNDLIALSEEPNVRIMESKALLCNVRPGNRARGPDALAQLQSVMDGKDGRPK